MSENTGLSSKVEENKGWLEVFVDNWSLFLFVGCVGNFFAIWYFHGFVDKKWMIAGFISGVIYFIHECFKFFKAKKEGK